MCERSGIHKYSCKFNLHVLAGLLKQMEYSICIIVSVQTATSIQVSTYLNY